MYLNFFYYLIIIIMNKFCVLSVLFLSSLDLEKIENCVWISLRRSEKTMTSQNTVVAAAAMMP